MIVLKKIEWLLIKCERLIMLAMGLILPIIISVGVFYRYVLKTDLQAIEELEVVIAMWFYFIGSAYASYKREQIAADILQVMLKSPKVRKALAIISALIAIAIGVLFAYLAWDMVSFSILRHSRTPVRKIPLWSEYIAIFIGLVLMAVYSLRDLVTTITRDFSKPPQEG